MTLPSVDCYTASMDIKTKSQAVNIFQTATALANALGITKSAIGQWKDELTERQINEVTGAAIRLGFIKPSQIKRSA